MKAILQSLKNIANSFGDGHTTLKKQLLLQAASIRVLNITDLINYHELLLFIFAYPDNEEILGIVTGELKRIASVVKKITGGKNEKTREKLKGSGIAYTNIVCNYSYDIAKWLSDTFGENARIHSSDANKNVIRETVRLFFPEPEYWQTTQDDLNIHKRIGLLKGGSKTGNLAWLVEQTGAAKYNSHLRDYLFNNLNIFILWQLNDEQYSRTFIRGLPHRSYYHTEIIKKINSLDIIDGQLSAARTLSSKDRQHLLNAARTILALYCSETDTITHCDINEITFFELERGLSIALYGMNKERRFSMEAYVGYMVFKNAVPVAYGGAWMLGGHCKIGINIFPPFRGGESAYIFSRVIRVYHQYYGMDIFAVKPYQFGKDNSEGLKTAAYWFYYKLGFRSSDKKIAAIAEKEREQIKKVKNYRTPLSVLKQFTESNIELVLDTAAMPVSDASVISSEITRMINEAFASDRVLAISECSKNIRKELNIPRNQPMTEIQRLHFNELCLWFNLIKDLHQWSMKDKKALYEILLLKGDDDERKYIIRLKAHKRLWQSMRSIYK